MSPSKLSDDIENLILSANDVFASEVERVQNILYRRLLPIIKNIEVDREGYIIQSAANRQIIQDASKLVDEVLPGTTYTGAINDFINIIPEVNDINTEYFQSISEGFLPNKNFIKALQKQTITSIESTLMQDGLASQIKTPLIDILNRNVNTGGSFSGFLNEIQSYILGNDKLDGRLLSYSRNITADALFNYSRSLQQSLTADLGLEFYLYAGGLIKDSRDFCKERAGEYFSHSEVESWAKLNWQGRNKFTTESSIFTFCGGYACRHSLIPVDISKVPKEVIERQKK